MLALASRDLWTHIRVNLEILSTAATTCDLAAFDPFARAQPKTPGAPPGALGLCCRCSQIHAGMLAEILVLPGNNFETDFDLVFHPDGSSGDPDGCDPKVGLLEHERAFVDSLR